MRKKQRKRKTSFLRLLFNTIYTLALLLTAGVVLGVGISLSQDLPNIKAIGEYRPNETSKVYDANGRLLANLCIENREFVPITDIPQVMQNSIVAIEDSRFFKHHGVDIRGIGRALVENFRGGGIRQGGSTITQQLARNIFLSHKRTITRKLREAILALQIERKYSKEEILELYLNQVYFGSGAYGIETASQIYYGKKAQELNLAEAALLAGLPKAPSSYSPYINMDLAKSRQTVVLRRMADLNFITKEEAKAAGEARIRLAGTRTAGLADNKAPYFVSYLLFPLIDKYGADMVYKGGLRIETSLDLDMQEAAEKAVSQGLKEGKNLRVSQAALVALDVKTGQIKAMVGGRSFKESQFNRATQAKRQPGSAFKPFVYTAAIDSGMKPADTIVDSPVSYGSGSGIYSPRNYDGRFRGTITLRSALERSINVPAVKLMDKLGILNVLDYVKRMGISTVSPVYDSHLACALGGLTHGVIPLEMATAYGVLANEGIKCQPAPILRITDRWGNVLEEYRPRTERVLRQETANTMVDMMRGVITRGTGRGAAIGYPASGKTGTTSSYKDAWFVGYTNKLVTAVWIGNDNNRPMAHGVTGGALPARIWSAFMRPAMKRFLALEAALKGPAESVQPLEDKDLNKNAVQEKTAEEQMGKDGSITIQVCPSSGLPPSPDCPEVITKTFASGKAPSGTCNVHGEGRRDPAERRTDSSKEQKPSGQAEEPHAAQPRNTDTTGARTTGVTIWQEVRFCRLTGKPATGKCPETYTRYIRKDRISRDFCEVHN